MYVHDMKVEMVPTGSLTQHPDNANNGDVDALEESIEVNGFYAPLHVQRSTGYVVAGNHRLLVAMRVGMPFVPVIYHELTDEQAIRLMLADNAITRHGFDDEPQLLNLLDALYATDLGLHGTGFTVDERERLSISINEPLDFEANPVRDTRLDADNDVKGHARFAVIPQFDEDGVCYELVLQKEGGGAVSKSDANYIRRLLGFQPFSQSEIDAFGERGWR